MWHVSVAQRLFDEANHAVGLHNESGALIMLKSALKLEPGLYEKAEKNPNMKRALTKLPEWAPMIEAAQQAAETKQAMIKQRSEDAKEKRKKREEDRKQTTGTSR